MGRTDLHGTDRTVELAHSQWRSARRLLEELPASALVLPTHGFGSLCSAAPAADAASATLADEASVNPSLMMAERPFVASLVAGYGAVPAHYDRLPLLNAAGPLPLDVSPPRHLTPRDLEQLRRAGHWLVDVRNRRAFSECHLRGTVNIEVTGPLTAYLPWILPPGAGVALLGSRAEVNLAQRLLAQVGIDRPLGAAVGTPQEWSGGDRARLGSYPIGSFADFVAAEGRGAAVALDVRSGPEWSAGHVRRALHLSLPDLARVTDPSRVSAVSAVSGDVHVYCGSGFRAAVAASLLDAAGSTVTLIDAPFSEAQAAGLTTAADRDAEVTAAISSRARR